MVTQNPLLLTPSLLNLPVPSSPPLPPIPLQKAPKHPPLCTHFLPKPPPPGLVLILYKTACPLTSEVTYSFTQRTEAEHLLVKKKVRYENRGGCEGLYARKILNWLLSCQFLRLRLNQQSLKRMSFDLTDDIDVEWSKNLLKGNIERFVAKFEGAAKKVNKVIQKQTYINPNEKEIKNLILKLALENYMKDIGKIGQNVKMLSLVLPQAPECSEESSEDEITFNPKKTNKFFVPKQSNH
ncbi:unnamed protein product [Moneuplotes crassus]|uniref:Uncharacterized protein n=1 Tax=Euplotes crassus TaxID=5936 RepID=A0AAD1UNC5_EUPCR|nr:unnamed protein product [Moneuplotes crassus]